MPDRKIIFCSKFAIKTLPGYRCKCWRRIYKISYIIWYVFRPHASEIWTKSYGLNFTKFLAFWQKVRFKKIILYNEFMPFCKTVLKLKQLFNDKRLNFQATIFQCPKNYGSPTRVTRLKVAPYMADPTSIEQSIKNRNL